jgi:hypothetical protein
MFCNKEKENSSSGKVALGCHFKWKSHNNVNVLKFHYEFS